MEKERSSVGTLFCANILLLYSKKTDILKEFEVINALNSVDLRVRCEPSGVKCVCLWSVL